MVWLIGWLGVWLIGLIESVGLIRLVVCLGVVGMAGLVGLVGLVGSVGLVGLVESACRDHNQMVWNGGQHG